jgi:periplasmic divalent cation tolerance protein
MEKLIQIVTTTSSQSDARMIAVELLSARLAACVQISGPIESHYVWQGKQEQAAEWLCTIKTLAIAYSQVEARIHELHPHDEPEILATDVVNVSAGYAAWVAESVG